MEEVLLKIAKAIEKQCGNGGCPCHENCDVYSDEDCMNRIINWLLSIVEAKTV